jgi:hypothetical protein
MKPGRRFTEVESCSIVSLRCRGTWRGDVICNITARSSLSPRVIANGLRDASRASRSHRDKLGGARKSPHLFRKIQPSNGRPPGCRPKTRRLAAARVGRRRATNVAGTMTRLSSLLLVLMLAVTPTVSVVCRAVCTPNPTPAASPSCHEVAPDTADGVWSPGLTCQRDAVVAVAQADWARNIVAPAPLVTTFIVGSVLVPACSRAGLRRQTPRPPSHRYASTTVLRI